MIKTIDLDVKLKEAFDFIENSKEDMIQLWEKMVNKESGTNDKDQVDEFCEFLSQELNKLNVETNIEVMNKSGNFLKGYRGSSNDIKPILLVGHMDTVFKTGITKTRPFKIVGDRAYGPGVLDMKAGLVLIVYIIKALNHINYDERPIKIAIAGDEENAHRYSNAVEILESFCEDAHVAFNFETGYVNDGLVVSRKGSYKMNIEVTGVAAHSGNAPEKGRSAIVEMSNKILRLNELNDYKNGLSLNVGLISGGLSANTIPEKCKASIDIRFINKSQLNKVESKVKEIINTTYIEGTKCEYYDVKCNANMEESVKTIRLFNYIRSVAQDIGYGDVVSMGVGGWSDSSVISSKGIPVVCGLGVKGEWNHSPNEYAIVDSLFSRAKLAIASIIKLENDYTDMEG